MVTNIFYYTQIVIEIKTVCLAYVDKVTTVYTYIKHTFT